MTYPDKKTFVGDWLNDKIEGPGKEIDPNNKSFKIGYWKNDKFAWGLTFSFGSSPSGSGIICNDDTSIYDGSYEDYKMHGRGKYSWPSYDDERKCLTGVYDGNWFQGAMHGQGKRTWAEGDFYEGEFKNGLMHGKGKYTSLQYEYEGDWKMGLMHGYGKSKNVDGNFEGYFKDGGTFGHGKQTKKDGTIHEGSWNEKGENGLIKITNSDGTKYEVYFKDGIKEVEDNKESEGSKTKRRKKDNSFNDYERQYN